MAEQVTYTCVKSFYMTQGRASVVATRVGGKTISYFVDVGGKVPEGAEVTVKPALVRWAIPTHLIPVVLDGSAPRDALDAQDNTKEAE